LDDSWLLVPADHPLLEPSVIQILSAARNSDTKSSIFVPTYEGRRGHPILLTWHHVTAIQQLPLDHGLNWYIRSQASATLEVAVATRSILVDVDTPDDYDALLVSDRG